MTGAKRCGYAQPGTFGHECGRPAVFVGIKPSIFTATGTFYAYRCAECREFTGEDMEESMGPRESQCPLSILALLPPTDSEYANNWRQRCRDYAAAKSARPKLAAGIVLRYGPHHYRLDDPAGPRRGWRVSCVETGGVYRMDARQLNAASVVDPASLPAFPI